MLFRVSTLWGAYHFAASLVSVAVNTSLNYLLIFDKLGLPSMGIPGAALASLASQMVNFLLVLLGFVILKKRRAAAPFGAYALKSSAIWTI